MMAEFFIITKYLRGEAVYRANSQRRGYGGTRQPWIQRETDSLDSATWIGGAIRNVDYSTMQASFTPDKSRSRSLTPEPGSTTVRGTTWKAENKTPAAFCKASANPSISITDHLQARTTLTLPFVSTAF
jgi:hypothetical protein